MTAFGRPSPTRLLPLPRAANAIPMRSANGRCRTFARLEPSRGPQSARRNRRLRLSHLSKRGGRRSNMKRLVAGGLISVTIVLVAVAINRHVAYKQAVHH